MVVVNVVTIAAYRLMSLVQRSASTWRCVLRDELGELSHWLCHDDSTINIGIGLIIIIIITILLLSSDNADHVQ